MAKLPELPKPRPRPPVVDIAPGAPQLFVDDYLIDRSENLVRRLGDMRKYEGNPVLSPGRPWEGGTAFPFGGGVYRIGGEWRMWYNTYRRWLKGRERTSLCYATSHDGIDWQKPSLSLHEVAGTRKNNVVLSLEMDNCSVIYDPEDPDADRRFKAVAYTKGDEGTGLYGFTSEDGVHWRPSPRILIPKAGDRTSFWYDALRKRYVVFTRYRPVLPGRYIFRAESEDFLNWTTPELVLHWSEIDLAHGRQHYGANGFVYGDMYLGFLEVFHYPYRRLDTELICSRDGRAWERVCEGEVFLPNGPDRSFDQFWAFPAASPPIRVGDELWIYYAGRMHPHSPPGPPAHGREPDGTPKATFWAATGLVRMRVDGFASLDASGEEGVLVTVPVRFVEGRELRVNADVDRPPPGSSWLKVGFLDEEGRPIAGFSPEGADTIKGDSVAHRASWGGRWEISPLSGRPVRLAFRFVNTRLYSFTVR